jgi:hypothetical protein
LRTPIPISVTHYHDKNISEKLKKKKKEANAEESSGEGSDEEIRGGSDEEIRGIDQHLRETNRESSDQENSGNSQPPKETNSEDAKDNSPPSRQAAPKPKKLFIPDLDGNHQTFIDHGCTLDKEGYPLYPNGNTTFVKLPEDTVVNFGMVGFPKTQSVNRRGRNKAWKVTRYYCLGALTCDNDSCKWVGAPPTGAGKIQEIIEK